MPKGKAYHIDVQPFYPGSFQEGYNHTVLAEVTRVWRRFRSIEKKGTIGVTVNVHEDIQFVVQECRSQDDALQCVSRGVLIGGMNANSHRSR